jgi:hypothetical protein
LAAIGLERETTERKTQQRLMEILRARLSDDQREKLFSHGAAMSPERAISEARQGATNGFGPR